MGQEQDYEDSLSSKNDALNHIPDFTTFNI